MDIDWCRQNPCWWEAGKSSLASSSQAATSLHAWKRAGMSVTGLRLSDKTLRNVEVFQSSCKMTYRWLGTVFAYYLL